GGYDGTYKNDVWYSNDGLTWTEATSAPPFSGRSGHTTAVFDNKLWVIGGYDGTYKNDVWYSNDGLTWTEA
ncbi:Kelch repeat-containing protein, partial [Zobellia russellii]